MTNEMQTAAIVGAGLIGRSWANVFARAGWQVRVWDPSAAQRDAAHAQIAQSLHELQAHALVSNATAAAARVHIVATLEEAVEAADYVQESGPETLKPSSRRLQRSMQPHRRTACSALQHRPSWRRSSRRR